MIAFQGTVSSCDTDRSKVLAVRGKVRGLIGDYAGNGKREFIPEMELPDPEGFGLKLVQRNAS
jgi:hypothetical protein